MKNSNMAEGAIINSRKVSKWTRILSSKLWTFLCQGNQKSRVQVLKNIPRGGHDIGKGMFCEKAECLERMAKCVEHLKRTGFMERRKNAREDD